MKTKWVITLAALMAGMVPCAAVFGQAMYINPEGNVGVGINPPLTPLHVFRDDGSAQILVEESTATVGARTLMMLGNPGNTKFEIMNTDLGLSWAFTNSKSFEGSSSISEFRISRQGTGQIEFTVYDTGDAKLAGVLQENSDVNAKQAIVPVDPHEVLKRVSALPISQWQYKDTPGVNHIGPMAQDFYAAFGLGTSEKAIATLDTSGVALAAIQALSAENAELKARLEALEQQQAQMQAVMVRMLEQQAESRPIQTSLN
jgi:hypothetical protein